MNQNNNVSKGTKGESRAAEFLQENGYTILHRNKRYAHWETDIICENEQYLVFAEVKTRKYNSAFGRPAAAVNAKKKQNLISCAEAYIAENGTHGKQVRLDVIEVYESNGNYRIMHLKNAITK